jgi:hypothetical protein
MATRSVADRPFQDLDVLEPRALDEVAPIDVVAPADEVLEGTGDPLSPARGILLALLLSTPFWIGVVYWLVW